TFEQAAGFLRVAGGENILDNTAVHPESYELAEKIIGSLGFDLTDVEKPEFKEALKDVDAKELASKFEAGLPTVIDIVDSLQKPGRDPREDLPGPVFRSDVMKFEDLKVGQVLTGTVRNVVDFGAFVDIGVKRDGLIHVSKLPKGHKLHPTQQISVGEIVEVVVTEIDTKRQRISLKLSKKVSRD
ncbi:MAG TPA: S1 RNA-binding domain-containing protein, partial [Bacillota bacterium]|nr:S1 RNA-binding domain-containing protein [Bacillota bacterium]